MTASGLTETSSGDVLLRNKNPTVRQSVAVSIKLMIAELIVTDGSIHWAVSEFYPYKVTLSDINTQNNQSPRARSTLIQDVDRLARKREVWLAAIVDWSSTRR